MEQGIPSLSADLDAWSALDAVPECVMITDANLEKPGPTILYVNPAFERMTGWRREEILGQTPRVLQGPRTDRSIFASLRATLAAGRSWEGRGLNYRRDGAPFWVEWVITPQANQGRPPRFIVAVQRDAAGRIETEERLIQADLAKSDFLAMVTDELRMPLSIMIGYAALMADSLSMADGERVAGYAEVIRQTGVTMLETVDAILDHARSGSGRVELSWVDLDLRFILDSCVEDFRRSAHNRGAILTLAPGPPEVVIADELRVRQIFANIVGNAVKHGREGGRIDLSLSGAPDGVAILVADDGPGVPEEMQARVFEPFFVMHPAFSRSAQGVGLGLTIARRFIEMHGGTVDILPGTGIGTTFRLWFPRRQSGVGVL